jgi:hypothetical protein
MACSNGSLDLVRASRSNIVQLPTGYFQDRRVTSNRRNYFNHSSVLPYQFQFGDRTSSQMKYELLQMVP